MAAVGVDLGGTKVLAARVEEGVIQERVKVATPGSGADAVVDAVVGAVEQIRRAGDGPVGLGVPGVVDPGTGNVVRAPNLPGFEHPVALGDLLEARLGSPVVIDNDVNVGTLAEQRLGAARGRGNVLGMFVGTGVGGGLVLDGALRRGSQGMAGEIGHTVVGGDRRCGCGRPGHLEAYAGRAAMEREARRMAAAGRPSLLVEKAGDGPIKSGAWKRALDAGDEVTAELLEGAVAALGMALASAHSLLDVDVVVVGGGLAEKLGQPFADRVGDAARDHLMLPETAPRVVLAALGDDAGVLGAAVLALDPG